jgi:hypothetical protein
MDAMSSLCLSIPEALCFSNFATQKWEEIAKIAMGFPNWSKTGDYVYFLHEVDQPSVMRVRIRDRELERAADLKNFQAHRLLQYLARHDSRRFTSSASRHGHTGNLRSRLASPVTHTRRSDLSRNSELLQTGSYMNACRRFWADDGQSGSNPNKLHSLRSVLIYGMVDEISRASQAQPNHSS